MSFEDERMFVALKEPASLIGTCAVSFMDVIYNSDRKQFRFCEKLNGSVSFSYDKFEPRKEKDFLLDRIIHQSKIRLYGRDIGFLSQYNVLAFQVDSIEDAEKYLPDFKPLY